MFQKISAVWFSNYYRAMRENVTLLMIWSIWFLFNFGFIWDDWITFADKCFRSIICFFPKVLLYSYTEILSDSDIELKSHSFIVSKGSLQFWELKAMHFTWLYSHSIFFFCDLKRFGASIIFIRKWADNASSASSSWSSNLEMMFNITVVIIRDEGILSSSTVIFHKTTRHLYNWSCSEGSIYWDPSHERDDFMCDVNVFEHQIFKINRLKLCQYSDSVESLLIVFLLSILDIFPTIPFEIWTLLILLSISPLKTKILTMIQCRELEEMESYSWHFLVIVIIPMIINCVFCTSWCSTFWLDNVKVYQRNRKWSFLWSILPDRSLLCSYISKSLSTLIGVAISESFPSLSKNSKMNVSHFFTHSNSQAELLFCFSWTIWWLWNELVFLATTGTNPVRFARNRNLRCSLESGLVSIHANSHVPSQNFLIYCFGWRIWEKLNSDEHIQILHVRGCLLCCTQSPIGRSSCCGFDPSPLPPPHTATHAHTRPHTHRHTQTHTDTHRHTHRHRQTHTRHTHDTHTRHAHTRTHTTHTTHSHTHNTTQCTQHNTTQHNTTLHNTRQHNTTQHNTTQHHTTPHHTTSHHTTQHHTTPHHTTPHTHTHTTHTHHTHTHHTHTTQHNTTQHNTTQHNTTQHNTTQHNTHNTTQHNTTQTQHNTTQHNTTQHNTTQHNTTQHNTTQHNTTQHNTTQHNTTQHNTTQHHTPRMA